MAADDPTAELEEIRADLRLAESAGLADEDAPGDYFPVALYHRSRSLLAAIEAVLKAHRPLDRGRILNCCVGCEAPNGDWHEDCCHEWPCPTYLAISRSLSGKEESAADA